MSEQGALEADASAAAGPRIETTDPALPIEGYTELDLSVDRMWEIFGDVRGWRRWNKCFGIARVGGGELKQGAQLFWIFNQIKPWYPYKLPSTARIVECEPRKKVTWEVTALPGFHALHSYLFEELGPTRCRFGSWEVAEGPTYRAMRRFWVAHFRYVCRESLAGARRLAGQQ